MNVNEIVTDRIIKELENGVIPWHQPWCIPSRVQSREGRAYSRATGYPYSLINQMLLGKPGEYLTYKQAQEAGGQVRKGEKSKIVVFWKQIEITEKDENNVEKQKKIPYLRYYNVFHIDQVDGITARIFKTDNEPARVFEPEEEAESVFNGYTTREHITVTNVGSNRAYYTPMKDSITLPLRTQFQTAGGYYETAFHEAVHSTGHEKRLKRIAGHAAFGSEVYSKEELTAEIGAACIMTLLKLETEATFRNNVAYIQSWLKALKDDQSMIVSAAGRAEKAVAMIMQLDAPEE
jgi:antirestriction protein ArdC